MYPLFTYSLTSIHVLVSSTLIFMDIIIILIFFILFSTTTFIPLFTYRYLFIGWPAPNRCPVSKRFANSSTLLCPDPEGKFLVYLDQGGGKGQGKGKGKGAGGGGW